MKTSNRRSTKDHLQGSQPTVWTFAKRALLAVVGAIGVAVLVPLGLLFRTSAPPAVHIDPSAGKQLEEKWRRAQAEPKGSSAPPLTASETELNSLIASYLPGTQGGSMKQGGAVQDVKIRLSGDRMSLHALIDFHGKNITADLESRLWSQDGYAHLDPLSARIGSFPIPRATLADALLRMMRSPVDRERFRLPDNIRDLKVEDGKIVVVYK
jgi:hypothetical protein